MPISTKTKPSTNGKPKRSYKSGAQIDVEFTGRHTPVVKPDDRLFPEMVLDPTILLAIDIVTAIMLQNPWTVECDDDEYAAFVWSQLEPYRKFVLEKCLWGFLKNGYSIFESLYDIEEIEVEFQEEVQVPPELLGPQQPPTPPVPPKEKEVPDEEPVSGEDKLSPPMPPAFLPRTTQVTKRKTVLRQVLAGLKPLKPDRTDIVLDKTTGDVIGCINKQNDGTEVFIDKDHTVFINLDKDGYGEYGVPVLRAAIGPYKRYNISEKGAQRYDEKVAGGFLWIEHPIGTIPYTKGGGVGGEETDMSIIARDMATSMRSVGYACVPVGENDQGEPIKGWKAEFLNDGGMQHSFVDRLKYLDGQKMRAFGVPERSATEGSLGTKAEAEAHADIAILVNLQRVDVIINALNTQVLEPLNRSNTGEPGKARVLMGKLDPDSRELFANIFMALMADPLFADQLSQQVDGLALADKLDIPLKQVQDFSEGPDDA